MSYEKFKNCTKFLTGGSRTTARLAAAHTAHVTRTVDGVRIVVAALDKLARSAVAHLVDRVVLHAERGRLVLGLSRPRRVDRVGRLPRQEREVHDGLVAHPAGG